MRRFESILMAMVVAMAAFMPCVGQAGEAIILTSPNGELVMTFNLTNGVPTYSLDFGGQAVILPSRMGFELKGGCQLTDGFGITLREL